MRLSLRPSLSAFPDPRAVADALRVLALAACALLLAACSRGEVFHHEAYVFGTRVDVAVHGDSQAEADAAAAAVLREFDRLHRAYHAWEPSELTALNESLARGEAATVSDELAAMLKDAQHIAATGDQLFNPALGGLIALIACPFGLRVKPNTESLSSRTTTSVVTSITVAILVDAVFAVLTRGVGLP